MNNPPMNRTNFYPAAMTIAGSDSGGGAGIQADLRTFSAFGVFGCSAVAAVTAQNPFRVSGIYPVPPEGVAAQIRRILEAFEIPAAKTGMLFSKEIIETVVRELESWHGELVVDPVMISTSGAKLLEPEAADAMKKLLLPRAAWITPNIPEAEAISGMKIASLADMRRAAEKCHRLFGCGVIVKGGHAAGGNAVDCVVSREGASSELSAERLEITGVNPSHGTGCTFSAAMAANLALGKTGLQAAAEAKKFVWRSLSGFVHPGERVSAMFPERFRIV